MSSKHAEVGLVPESWAVEELRAFCSLITYGFTNPMPDADEGPWKLTAKDVVDGRINYDTARRTTQDAFDRLTDKSRPRVGDVLLTKDGSIGRVAVVDREGICINQSVALIRPNARIIPDFLKYLLFSPHYQKVMEGDSDGSTIKHIYITRVDKMQVAVPPVEEQKKFLEVIKGIDDRITLLRETNTTLEAIAQALFKSWFVDFDPVHAKMQGRAPEGMDQATAALFPDSFEESELGPVPNGWSLCPVYDLATFINGAAYKAFEPNAERRGLPIIKIAELKSGVSATTAFSAVDMPKKYLIELGDILFSWSGNPDTSIDTFVWPHEAAWLNQHIFRVLPNEQVERALVLNTLRYLRPVFAELARNKQTTGLGHVTVADLKRLLIVKPDSKLLDLFNQIAGPVQQRIFENERQAILLSKIRDNLLPRLIYGQLEMKVTYAG